MKTLTIDIQDSSLKEFLNFVQKSQNKIFFHKVRLSISVIR